MPNKINKLVIFLAQCSGPDLIESKTVSFDSINGSRPFQLIVIVIE